MASIEDAQKYVRMGFSVIPVKSHDKVAAVSWADYQKRLPTEQEIKQWFNGGENNIAIICGKVSGNLVVFDFDDLSAIPFVMGSIGEVAKKTMVVRTGKGYHVYYRMKEPSNFKLSNIRVDVKGEGGYVLAPPSIHPSGVRYEVVGTDKIADAKPELMNRLKEADQSIALARVVESLWGSDSTHRHELSLGLASFFKVRAKWPQDAMERFIQGIMRMKNDMEEEEDRLRAVADAYKKEYPYNKHLSSEMVEKLVRLLPVGAGEIWRWYDKGGKDEPVFHAYMCNSVGVFRIYHKEWYEKKDNGESELRVEEDIETIFTQPLTLVDAWHAEGDEENHVKFTYYLGKMKYQGTKTEVYNQIIDSGLTGINRNYIRDTLSACVEYYVSTGSVSVRQSYEAVGVYETDGRLEMALGDKDISATRGTEPWFVLRQFNAWKGDMTSELQRFGELGEYFDQHILVVFFGFSAIAPFSYALKANGNLFWPLVILKGPPATGKTTLGQLFTTYLFGLQDGGPSDVTSDFRLLDFLTGTTFPRLVDESENAKFEGQKFSIKISTTLKDAAQKQFVGSRGNIDKTKKIYAARTPLILAGNKIDIEDPALLTRSIIISTNQSDKVAFAQRKRLNDEILAMVGRGFGIELVKFMLEKYHSINDIINDIRKVKIDFQFSDPRRADFYASIYLGLSLWNEFYESQELKFPLNEYLSIERFTDIVLRFETSNLEESKERQTIQEFIEWAKTQYNILQDIIKEHLDGNKYPDRFFTLRNTVTEETDETGKTWLLVTQPMVTDYCRLNPTFSARSLSEVADNLSEFFGTDRLNYYDRGRIRLVGGKSSRVVRIPMDVMDLSSYGTVKGDKGPPPPKPTTTNYRQTTSAGSQTGNSPEANGETLTTTLPEKVYAHADIVKEKSLENSESSGKVVVNIRENKDSTGSILTTTMTTMTTTSGSQKDRFDEKFLNSIDRVKTFLNESGIHGRIDEIKGKVYVNMFPFSELAHWLKGKMRENGFEVDPESINEDKQVIFRYHQVSVDEKEVSQ